MFNGTVDFVATLRGTGLTFPSLDFNPQEPGVAKVVIEGPEGDEIRSTVHLENVASRDDGIALATKVNTAALDRLAYFRRVAVENARRTGDQFSEVNQPAGVHAVAITSNFHLSGAAGVVVGVAAAVVKGELEQAAPPGEHHFRLFRSARLSLSSAEEFMHLYNILLMLYNDNQAQVDVFIVSEDAGVPQTQHPLKAAGVMETVYRRLRNELAHPRVGVNLDNTKAEMANRLGALIGLVQRAIELHP
jgi:hypothetical protein